jgi:5-methylcytosine-specific restriction protein A
MKKRRTCVHKAETTAMYNNARWKRLRAMKFKDAPICELCEAKGLTTIANVIHHKRPWQLGVSPDEQDELCYDYDNLQSLCHECHSTIHHGMRVKEAYERKR